MATNLATLLFGDASDAVVVDGNDISVGDVQNAEDCVVAWINANPPVLPEVQNHCAACGEFIPVHESGWVFLGDGALIHYSGKHGLGCWEVWKEKRRDAAMAEMVHVNTSTVQLVDDDIEF